MFGHIGHLGHLTPKPQQNRPFFNLSKMANNKYIGHLARPRAPALRSSASPAVSPPRPQPPLLPTPNSFLLTPRPKKLVDLVDLDNLRSSSDQVYAPSYSLASCCDHRLGVAAGHRRFDSLREPSTFHLPGKPNAKRRFGPLPATRTTIT